SELLDACAEDPESEGTDISELYERYIERGEIGAAQFLQKKLGFPPESVSRRKSQLTQQLNELLLDVRDAFLQVNEANPEAGHAISRRLERIEQDHVLLTLRQGRARQLIAEIGKELLGQLTEDRQRVQATARALEGVVRGNGDAELALRRVEELINIPEG